jgi:hypothetical protein
MDDTELYKRLGSLVQQVNELNRRVEFLFRHIGVEYVDDTPPPDDVAQLVIAGDRISAVKLYMKTHGHDIRAAKAAIDEIAARYGV